MRCRWDEMKDDDCAFFFIRRANEDVTKANEDAMDANEDAMEWW